MGSGKKQENSWSAWVLIVFLFAVGIWPVALFLLFFKLFGNDEKRKKAPPLEVNTNIPYQAQSAAPRTDRAKATARNVVRSPVAKKSNAKWLKIVGLVLAFVGLAACYQAATAIFWSESWAREWLASLLQYLALAVGGGAMFAGGLSMERSLKRYAKYLSVMGDSEAMPVEELARKLGYSEKRVEKDLQKMIDKGYFGGKAYLNVELGYLFRSGQADADYARKKREAAETAAAQAPKEETEAEEEGYAGILRNIRRANDAIADPELSVKIDRLEEITAKIFRAVEEDPQRESRIATFLSYYLPTTQKLLDAYGSFEAAGVEGENLRQAKARIEATMDSIVAGFEHQLDELYRGDAMDVDADIRVMETMLHRDAASVEQDFGLNGGTAAQRKEE